MKVWVKIVLFFLFLFLTVVTAIFVLSSYKNYELRQTIYVQEIKKMQDMNRNYEIKDERLNCMKKALMVAYGLSKWEAHYYSILFDDFSINYSIPWEIYPAIIRIESNFKVTLVSTKGAKGMMQILESTGKDVAQKLDLEYIESQTLWNDLINMVLGCEYLSEGIKEKGLEGGVKRYLGGPDFLKSAKANQEAKTYIGAYKTTVWNEYKLLTYIFRGIANESGKYVYKDLHNGSCFDSLFSNTNLFMADTIQRR